MKRLFLALLVIPQIAFADRAFYSAFSLVPGASALGNIKYSATPFTITANTSDAADNMVAQLSGGGAIGETRGSYIAVHGNEHSNAGAVNLWAGNTVSSNINHVLNNASAKVQIFNASTQVLWAFSNSGTFVSSNITNDIGWNPVNAANQACNTTCTSGCVFGMNTGALGNFVSCSDTTADTCICAGAS